MQVTIRGIEPTDTKDVHEIFLGENVIRGTLRMPHSSLASIEHRLKPDSNWHRFAAVLDEKVVGFAEVQTYPYPRLTHVAHLNMICVRDDMQGKGIGKLLMDTCMDLVDNYLLARRCYLEVWAESPAVKLYRQYGFEIEGKHIDYGIRDGTYADMLTMARIRK